MKIDSLEMLFKQELKDTYDAEKRLTKAIPKMAKAAQSEDLKTALQEHLEVTKNQVSRLEQVFGLLDAKPQAKTCAGMKGIIEEGEEMMGQDAQGMLGDVALIGSARRVEHYEIASYSSLIAMAESMGNEEIQDLLRQSLEEEEETDRNLEELGEHLLEQTDSDEDEEDDEELEDEDDEDMDMEDEDDEDMADEDEEVEDEGEAEPVPPPTPTRRKR